MSQTVTKARPSAPVAVRGASKKDVLEIAKWKEGEVISVTRRYKPIGCTSEVPIVEIWRIASMVPRLDNPKLADCRLELVGLNPILPNLS